MIQKLTRRISWRVSFFAYISKSLSLISICWRVCQKELDLYAGFHYNKKQRRMNLRENVFTYASGTTAFRLLTGWCSRAAWT